MPFFQPLDRPSATLWVRANPQSPVLRPCNFTETHPHILAVTYLVRGVIYHSLVERVGEAFYNVRHKEGTFERIRSPYSSEKELIHILLQYATAQEVDEDPTPVGSTDRGEKQEEDPS